MNELINKIDELIDLQKATIEMLSRTKADESYPDGDNRFISSSQICEDLNISKSYFSRIIRPEMPFLFRLRHNSDYRAKLSDYRAWKKTFFKV